MYMSAVPHSGQKRATDPLEVELQVVVNRSIWMLETKLRSSKKAIQT